MAEHKKYKKTGIVIIIGAILVLIMRLYILSAILFLIGLITATYPFIKKNTNEMSGLDIEDSKCNCENCDSLESMLLQFKLLQTMIVTT